MKDFVAIDSSTTSLAFAHFDDRHLVRWGIIKFSGQGIYEKVPDIAVKVGLLFGILETDRIVIESTFFSVNPKVTTDLALAQGAILGASGVKFIAGCPPIVWQKHIGNNPFTKMEKASLAKDNPGKSRSWYKAQPRKLRKQRTIRIVNKAYGLNIDDDNVADAIGLGIYAEDNWSRLEWQ
jgi:hypothetical protein